MEADPNRKNVAANCQVDDLLVFRQFQAKAGASASLADSFDFDVSKATVGDEEVDGKLTKLDKVIQLTGLSHHLTFIC